MPSSIHCFFFQTVSRTYLKVKRMLGETRRQKDCWKRMNRSDKRNRETFFFSWDLIFKTFEFKTTFRIFLMPIHAKTLVKTRKLILSVLLTNPHSVKISRMKKKHELSRSILKLRKVKVKEKSQIKAENEKKFVLYTKIRVQSKTLQFLFFLLEFFF